MPRHGSLKKDAYRNDPFNPDLQGKTILLAVTLTYPGSRISDVALGGQRIQIPNDVLRKSCAEALSGIGSLVEDATIAVALEDTDGCLPALD